MKSLILLVLAGALFPAGAALPGCVRVKTDPVTINFQGNLDITIRMINQDLNDFYSWQKKPGAPATQPAGH